LQTKIARQPQTLGKDTIKIVKRKNLQGGEELLAKAGEPVVGVR